MDVGRHGIKTAKIKNIKAQTETDLLDKLVSVYKAELNLEKMTFYKLYEECLEYKTPMANSLNAIKRHRQHYKKYFESSKLHSMRIDKIDTLILLLHYLIFTIH